MQFLFANLLILAIFTSIRAEAQQDSDNSNSERKFNAGGLESSYAAVQPKADGRFLFNTVTLSLQTTTITTTTTAIATCTTSTGGLSICTASGRRRRGLHLSGNKEGRGLFYNENEEPNENGNVFLPLPKLDAQSVKLEIETTRKVREFPEPIPYVVQPGYDAPVGQNRFYFTIGSTTVTSTSTTTSTVSLTAICVSTTGYQLCNSLGK